MQKEIFLLIIGMALIITPTPGDIPIEGITPYNYQYQITNTANFSDYSFLISSEIWGFDSPHLVNNGTFGGGYKLDGFILHAIRNSDLDPEVRESLISHEEGEKNLVEYFKNVQLATSSMLLPVSTGIDSAIPLSNITVMLQIEDIVDRDLAVSETKKVFWYLNGTVEEKFPSKTEESEDLLTGLGHLTSIDHITDSL